MPRKEKSELAGHKVQTLDKPGRDTDGGWVLSHHKESGSKSWTWRVRVKIRARCHHEVGAENQALLASLIANCEMGDIDPVSYLTNMLHALLDGHSQSRIDKLMPGNFEAASRRTVFRIGKALTTGGLFVSKLLGVRHGRDSRVSVSRAHFLDGSG